AESIALDLVLVELRGIEIGEAEGGEARHPPGGVRYLEFAGRGAADEAQAGSRVDDRRDIGEAAILRGAIVDGVEARGRGLDAENVLQVAAGEEVLGAAGSAAVF